MRTVTPQARFGAVFVVVCSLVTALVGASARGQSVAMPEYRPQGSVSGTLRIASGKLYGEKLLLCWEEGFHKYQPGVTIVYKYGKGSGMPLMSTICGLADVSLMGRELTPHEALGFYRAFTADPLILTTATGTYSSLDKTMAMIVIVHKDNPLSRLTMQQLDGIFGEARTGGYEGQYWRADRARGPEKNIRTWGQLGLTGEWADKAIQIYGYDIIKNAFANYFSQEALNGGDKWNPNLKEFGFSMTDGEMKMQGADHDKGSAPLVNAVAGDRYGIGYCAVRDSSPGVKALALAEAAGSPYVTPSLETVANRTYPLTRSIYWALNRPAGKPLDPALKEYLRYVLSRQGQEDVAREGQYLPLTPAVVSSERKKLD